jgi:hypothetical protein
MVVDVMGYVGFEFDVFETPRTLASLAWLATSGPMSSSDPCYGDGYVKGEIFAVEVFSSFGRCNGG